MLLQFWKRYFSRDYNYLILREFEKKFASILDLWKVHVENLLPLISVRNCVKKLSLTCVVRWPFDIFSCKELSKIWVIENLNRMSLKENYIQAWYLSVSLRSRHFRVGWNNYRFQTHQHSVTRISKTRLSSLYDREGKFSLQMELNWS